MLLRVLRELVFGSWSLLSAVIQQAQGLMLPLKAVRYALLAKIADMSLLWLFARALVIGICLTELLSSMRPIDIIGAGLRKFIFNKI